jgi:nucleoside-diphosphate-sugar epimerase
MRVFVTGASGWIGSAVVPELIASGHQVVGLARSDASAAALTAAGAEVHRGSLHDLDSLRAGAEASDGVIHLAFNHESAFSGDFAGAADTDRQVVEAFGEVLAGSDRPFLIASGVLGLALGQLATEHDGISPDGSVTPLGGGPITRMGTAQLTINLAEKGIRSSAVRLPPTCHGDGDNGFMATLVEIARAKGVAGYIGDGSNRWPATHRLDVAHFFALALDHAPAGSALHAVAEEGVPIRQVAEVIGRHLNVPAAPIAPEDAAEHFGFLSVFIGFDSPVSSVISRNLLDWKPTHPGLIEDMDEGHYFDGGTEAFVNTERSTLG